MSRQKCDFNGLVLLFCLDELRCALLLSSVERVVRSVEVTPLPKSPKIVMGVIDVQGRIIPIIDIRSRFGLPKREVCVDDRYIIAKTPQRPVALVVDSVIGVHAIIALEIADTEQNMPFVEYLNGVAKTKDGLVLIYDLDFFLSLDEERKLTECLIKPLL